MVSSFGAEFVTIFSRHNVTLIFVSMCACLITDLAVMVAGGRLILSKEKNIQDMLIDTKLNTQIDLIHFHRFH